MQLRYNQELKRKPRTRAHFLSCELSAHLVVAFIYLLIYYVAESSRLCLSFAFVSLITFCKAYHWPFVIQRLHTAESLNIWKKNTILPQLTHEHYWIETIIEIKFHQLVLFCLAILLTWRTSWAEPPLSPSLRIQLGYCIQNCKVC